MSTVVYITGDRSLPTHAAYEIVRMIIPKILIQHPEGVRFVTGNEFSGIERAVRFIIPEPFITVLNREKTAEGHIDWDKTSEEASKLAEVAVVVHIDPLNSRVAKSAMKYFEKVELPLEGIMNVAPDTVPATDGKVELSTDEKSAFENLVSGLTFDTDEKNPE